MELKKIIETYSLSPLEGEGGYFSFIDSFSALNSGSIFYLATKESFSSLHRLCEDEVWFFLEGSPAEQLLFDEKSGRAEKRVLDEEHRVSIVKAGLWQATRPFDGFSFFSTVMCPRFDESMYSSPSAELLDKHPFLKEYLNA